MNSEQLKKHMTGPSVQEIEEHSEEHSKKLSGNHSEKHSEDHSGEPSVLHPVCLFCEEHYFDSHQLYVHMKHSHVTCFLCPASCQHRLVIEVRVREHRLGSKCEG
jgi:hypothetical protein